MSPLDLLEFLRSHRLAVQASVSADGAPQAALVGIAVSDRFEIVFDTLETTRKAFNLRRDGRAAVVVGGWVPGDERTAQIEGVADQPQGADLERLKALYYGVYPDGVTRATWPGLVYMRVRPTWIRYTDYNRTPPEMVEYRAADLVP